MRVNRTAMLSGELTTGQLARKIGVSAWMVRHWAEAGLIPGRRTEGGHWRFRESDAQAAARRVAA